MAKLRRLLLRWANAIRPGRAEPELAREIAAHLALLEEEFVRRGLTRGEARLAARRAFGGVEQTKDRHRDARSFVCLDDVRRDFRHALRSLRRTPGFAVVIILTLALGIGANTAMFTLADALLLRPVAARDPARLIALAAVDVQGHAGGILAPMIDLIRDERLTGPICGFVTPSVIVEVHGRISALPVHAFSGDCFGTLGVRPAAGRLLTTDDERAGAPHVAVLGYDEWTGEYDGQTSALGQTIDVDGAAYRIVGIAQRGFTGVRVGFPARLYIPFGNFSGGLAACFPPRALMPMGVLARLRPDMGMESATAALRARWPAWLRASVPTRFGPLPRERYLHLALRVDSASTGIDDSLRSRFQKPIVALLGLAGLVLLLACVNVANLLLARSGGRRREATIRVALGASSRRLLQSAAIESGLLLAAGAIASVALAYWIDAGLIAIFRSQSRDFAIDLVPDRRVIAFTVALSAAAFVISALVPAWQASRTAAAAMSAASPRVSGDRRRLQRFAVGAQVALSLILLTVGTVFGGMLRALKTAPLGLSLDRVAAAQLSPVPGGYQQGFSAVTYYRTLLDRIEALPAIEAAALSYDALLTDVPAATPVGRRDADIEVPAEQSFVNDSFFSTTQIPLIAGTSFGRADRPDGVRTVVLSEALARALFGSIDAVGRSVRVGSNPLNQSLRVIGVAADAVLSSPRQRQTRVAYLNFWQAGPSFQTYPTLLVRTRGSSAAVVDVLDPVIRAEKHEYVSQIHTLTEQRDMSLVQERLLAALSTAFAALGLALAAVGLYGLLAFSVAQRTGELGIRMALGARRPHIVLLVLRDAGLLVALGAVVGAPCAWGASAFAAARLYEQSVPSLTSTIVAVALVLVVCLFAALLPARRATTVDPLVALRCE